MHVLFILIYFRSSVIIMQVRKGLQKAPRSLRPSSPPLALHQRGEKIMSFKDGVSKNMRLCDAEEALACSPFHPPPPPPALLTALQTPASVKYATAQLHISFDCWCAVLAAPVALNRVSR